VKILPSRAPFADFDAPAPDDDWLDNAFLLDELAGGLHGLVAQVPWRGRIRWDVILPDAEFVPGWEVRGAPVMAPIATLVHWTAAKPSLLRPAPSKAICIDGRDSIPGPLCHVLVSYTGVPIVIASGRANHAGIGDQSVLTAIKGGFLAPHQPGVDTGGSGGAFAGVEVENDGTAPLTAKQLVTIARIDAGMRAQYHWGATPDRSLDHARFTRRKIDLVRHRASVPCLKWLTAA
jgi:hypothetical protein